MTHCTVGLKDVLTKINSLVCSIAICPGEKQPSNDQKRYQCETFIQQFHIHCLLYFFVYLNIWYEITFITHPCTPLFRGDFPILLYFPSIKRGLRGVYFHSPLCPEEARKFQVFFTSSPVASEQSSDSEDSRRTPST